ncbi:splicing regulator RBM11-like isoform X1 [Leucoraja erinacea]|uniref:splicing regulator RBM11-like isoform X1 n=1 Tax=Leucoraja erinaceus TaxID=7782 RepID=UPI002453FE57|nr:splicing regulator RBM11-like isoform X1 [Leucoraja erinacea]
MSKQDEADRTVFVGNLDGGAREEILFELFLQAGPLTKVHIAKEKDGRQKTYGFVCFKHTESVPYAITLLNGIRLYGRPLNLQYRSGSSHNTDAGTPYLGAENTLCRMPQDNSRNVQFPSGPSSSLFLTPPYCMNNSYSHPDPYYWQAMMSSYTLQQYHLSSQLLQQQQQQQQQQYYPPTSVPPMPSFGHLQDLASWPCPATPDSSWPPPEPEPVVGGGGGSRGRRDSGGGGKTLGSDSDSDGRSQRLPAFSKHSYRKHKSKKKKY